MSPRTDGPASPAPVPDRNHTPHNDSAQIHEKEGSWTPDNSSSCRTTGFENQGESRFHDPVCGDSEAQWGQTPHNAPHTPDALEVAFFRHTRDTRPTRRRLAWPDLRDRLLTAAEPPCQRKEDVPAWSPARYVDGATRGLDGVEALTCLVLDYDGGASIAEARETWKGWEHVGHTSWSHRHDAPRFRVVLPLAKPVDAAGWPAVYAWAIQRAPTVDPSCKDVSRLWLLPVKREGSPFDSWHNVGDRLDVRDVTARQDTPVPASTPAPDRLAIAERLGASVVRSGRPRAEAIPCPGCKRESAWFYLAPGPMDGAACRHEKSCGWRGPLDALATGDPRDSPLDLLADAVRRACDDGDAEAARDRLDAILATATRPDAADHALADLLEGQGPVMLSRLEGARGFGDRARRLRRDATEAREARRRTMQAAVDRMPPGMTPHDAPDALTVPAGWRLTDRGLFTLDDDGAHLVSRRPPILTAIVRHADTGAVLETVAVKAPDGWRTMTLPTSDLRDTRAIVKQSDNGLDVSSLTARSVVAWLDAFRGENEAGLPFEAGSDRFGWHDLADGPAFLLGERSLGGDVRYLPTDGRRQYSRGLCERGDLDAWRRTVWDRLADHPRLTLAVYASIAPVLLGVVSEAPGFVLEWAGESGTGKTTALRVAASVWGDPTDDGGVVHGWNGALGGLRVLASTFHDLPLLLDETQQSDALARGDGDALGSFVYEVANGRGRSRGSVTGGAHDTADYRTIVLSTGEQPIVDVSQAAGLRARCMVLWGSPVAGPRSEASLALVGDLRTATADACGTLGPAVVSWLVSNRDRWPSVVEAWRDHRRRFEQELGATPNGPRFAAYLATLAVAGDLAAWAAGLTVRPDALAEALTAARSMAAQVDRALAALHHVEAWLAEQGGSLQSHDQGHQHSDRFKTIGVRGEAGGPPSVTVKAVNEALQSGGFQPVAIRRTWRERGWIEQGDNRRTVNGIQARCVTFTRKAWGAL